MEIKRNTILQGDALEVLKTLPAESIDCVITSPPYWALRDYGVAGQLGLEPTFQEYITKLCEIFDEVKRVLKSAGTCWVNLGDTYSSSRWSNNPGTSGRANRDKTPVVKKNLQEKSLCQIPARFALEMTDRGWLLRNTIIWHKKNAMPSSVLDRLTNKYEQVFFFVKSKKYFFDIDSIRVPFETEENRPDGIIRDRIYEYDSKQKKIKRQFNTKEGTKGIIFEKKRSILGIRREPQQENYNRNPLGKNPGDVWTLTSQPYPEAHFAMFPEKLVVPMIKAGCPKGGVVCDPFFGAGTTGVVALKLDRNYLGIELNPEYIKIAENRLKPLKNKLF